MSAVMGYKRDPAAVEFYPIINATLNRTATEITHTLDAVAGVIEVGMKHGCVTTRCDGFELAAIAG